MRVKGIVLDLDGTLVDTALDLREALNYALNKKNFPIATVDQTKEWIGNGMWNLIRRALPEDNREDEDLVNELVDLLNNYYKDHCTVKSIPYKHVIEILEILNQKNIKLSIISNKPNEMVQKISSEMFPTIRFDFISGHKEGYIHKPDPSLTLYGLKKQDLKPDEVLYIGDSITDFKTAVNAGIKPVLVRDGYENQELIENLEAEKINDFKEILNLIN